MTKVHESHPIKMASWLKEAQLTEAFNENNLPSLYKVFETTPLKSFDSTSSDNIEVITVTTMHRNSLLGYMLTEFKNELHQQELDCQILLVTKTSHIIKSC